MSRGQLAVVQQTAARPENAFIDVLHTAVRDEFARAVIVPAPGDVVLGMPVCQVPGCGRSSSRRGWCQAHYRRWDKDGRLEADQWSRQTDPATFGHRPLACCQVADCWFAQHRDQLCYRHSRQWRRQDTIDWDSWLAAQTPAQETGPICVVEGCRLWAELGQPGLCRSHRSRWLTQGQPDIDVFIFDCATYGEPRFDLRELSTQARLEIQYALQCRSDERAARTTPRAIPPAAAVPGR